MAIRIITDSSADFEPTVARRRQIDIVPMTIQFGSVSFIAGKTISNEVFYQLLQEGKENPSTSQPTPADFLQLFQEREGEDIPGWSYRSAHAVSDEVFRQFGGRSGTTLVAARNKGHTAVGIELSSDYHRIATDRLGLVLPS